MRGSDILRPADQRSRKWVPKRDTNVGRIMWEEVQTSSNHGCAMKMRWKLKPTKTYQARTKGSEKSFLLDKKPEALSAAKEVQRMVELRGAIKEDQK